MRHLSQSRAVLCVTRPCFHMVAHPAFEIFVMLLILANTVVLALDSHPMDQELDMWLENVNFVLTLAVRGGLRGRPPPSTPDRAHSYAIPLPAPSSGWKWC